MSIVPVVTQPPAYYTSRAKDTPEERQEVEATMKRAGCNRVEHKPDPQTGVLRSYGYPQ